MPHVSFSYQVLQGHAIVIKNLRDLIYDLQWFDEKKMTLLTTFL
jgi:hypothetical protein